MCLPVTFKRHFYIGFQQMCDPLISEVCSCCNVSYKVCLPDGYLPFTLNLSLFLTNKKAWQSLPLFFQVFWNILENVGSVCHTKTFLLFQGIWCNIMKCINKFNILHCKKLFNSLKRRYKSSLLTG